MTEDEKQAAIVRQRDREVLRTMEQAAKNTYGQKPPKDWYGRP